MKIHGQFIFTICALFVAASPTAVAELPPWWNDAQTPQQDESKNLSPARVAAPSADARIEPHPAVGPLLEQYTIQPHPPETIDDRTSAPPRDATVAAPLLPGPSVDDRYGIQPGDLLAISVWHEPDLTREVRVSPDGRVMYPLIGELNVEGLTAGALRTLIEAGLARYVTAAAVDVSIKEVVGNRVYVMGKVNRPGMYPFTKSLDVVQALSLAGGTAKFAEIDEIKILRRVEGQQQAFKFRYSDVERGRDLGQNIVLKSGDVIVVP
jgi:polysaccharide export outer membrane protein